MMAIDRPFSPAAERNRIPILEALSIHLTGACDVLEIGSGSGQHGLYFAHALPDVRWQCSELPENLAALQVGLAEANLVNLPEAIPLDVQSGLPLGPFDAIFTANTLHIMSWHAARAFIAALPHALNNGGLFVVYGPFNYGGTFTSASNAQFDAQLRAVDDRRGLRDFEAIDALLAKTGFVLVEDREMPSNNRCIFWQKVR